MGGVGGTPSGVRGPASGSAGIGGRAVLGWCFYDFANSPFSTLIVTAGYSQYFQEVVATGNRSALLWGIATSASTLAAAVLSPWLGAVADQTASKMRFLRAFTLACAAFTMTLALVGSGDVGAGMLLFVAANATLTAATSLNNAFLSEITPASRHGRVSAYGFGLGYLGGLLATAAVIPWAGGSLSTPQGAATFRWIFPITAAWLLAFSLPTFAWVRERPGSGAQTGASGTWGTGWRRIGSTLRELRRFRNLALFLCAYFLFIDGVDTIFSFGSRVARDRYEFDQRLIFLLFIFSNFVAAVGTTALGFVTDRVGPHRVIGWALAGVLGLLAAVALGSHPAVFWGAALALGCLLGAIQSAARALMARLSPPERQAEFFGFFSLTGRMGAAIGPIAFGALWSPQAPWRAIGFLMGLIGTGLWLLRRVDVEHGEREARSA
ncbi:MAG: MFS transporter [Planctomycetes bacterium]|nr:MFS transporter [Planctomycetota bacterium]